MTSLSTTGRRRAAPPRARVLVWLVWLAGCTATRSPPELAREGAVGAPHASAPRESAAATGGNEGGGAATPSAGPLSFAAAGAPPGTLTALAAPVASEEEGVPVHGSLGVRFRGRKSGSQQDGDLWTTLSLDVGDAKRHPFTGHFLGRLYGDAGERDPGDLFFGLDDTFGTAVNGILYYAYVDAHELGSLELLRLGRQQIWDTPVFVAFDGLKVDAGDPAGIRFGAWGGQRVQYYDTPTPTDFVGGVYGEARPWTGGRLRADYMYLEDDQRLGTDQNDLLSFDLWQLVGEAVTLEGEYTRLEGQDRDLRLRGHYFDADSDLSLSATYYHLLQTQKNFALELNPYFSSLLEYDPFQQIGLLASKGFADSFNVNLGLDLRRLESGEEAGEFNHEFDHYYLSTIFLDVLVRGLDLTLIGDVWDDDQQDIQTWGLDLTQEFETDYEASLGSYYSMYKYDLFQATEQDDVRTYYARVRHAWSEALVFDAAYEYENIDSTTDFHTLRLGTRWRF